MIFIGELLVYRELASANMLLDTKLPIHSNVDLLLTPPIRTILSIDIARIICQETNVHPIHLLTMLMTILHTVQDFHNHLLYMKFCRDVDLLGPSYNFVPGHTKLSEREALAIAIFFQ